MFGNIYRKYILRALRTKDMIAWTLLFPILLSTLFYFAFAALDKDEVVREIPIAVVEDENYEKEISFSMMLEELSKGENPLLKVIGAQTEEEADKLLRDDEIEGWISIQEAGPALAVKESGIHQTVLKNILDQYVQIKDTVTVIAEKNPLAAVQMLNHLKGEEETQSIEKVSFSGQKVSETVNYYYALLAMICMYGGFHGLAVMESMQANLSPQGARNTVSPGNRGTLFGASFLAALSTHFLCVCAALCYIRFVLRISFGGQLPYAVLTCFVGSVVGISFGCMLAIPSRWKSAMKNGMLVAVSLGCSFLAGLMVRGVNYIVQEKAPAAAFLNPAARIADAFYCLYYYDNHVRYLKNIGILLIMAAVMIGISLAASRRKQYESI